MRRIETVASRPIGCELVCRCGFVVLAVQVYQVYTYEWRIDETNYIGLVDVYLRCSKQPLVCVRVSVFVCIIMLVCDCQVLDLEYVCLWTRLSSELPCKH